MAIHDDLGNRMKSYYETVPKTKLMRKCPVIVRIDGKAFHTFTRNFQKPFDDILIQTMQETTKQLCADIMGCVLGYTQSDEISLLLIDYDTIEKQAYFDYEIQKMCSVISSSATLAFNKYFTKFATEFLYHHTEETNAGNSLHKYKMALQHAMNKGATFDCRVFNIPKEEVTNYFLWRQLDAMRNSVQMVARANFTTKELHKKNTEEIKKMLLDEKSVNWNNINPVYQKGSCVKKCLYITDNEGKLIKFPDNVAEKSLVLYNDCKLKRKWEINQNIPIFKNEGRNYIETLVQV